MSKVIQSCSMFFMALLAAVLNLTGCKPQTETVAIEQLSRPENLKTGSKRLKALTKTPEWKELKTIWWGNFKGGDEAFLRGEELLNALKQKGLLTDLETNYFLSCIYDVQKWANRRSIPDYTTRTLNFYDLNVKVFERINYLESKRRIMPEEAEKARMLARGFKGLSEQEKESLYYLENDLMRKMW